MKPGDLGAIVKLHGEFYYENYGFDATFEPYVAQPMSEFVLKGSERECLWIVEDEGMVRGSIAIVEHEGDVAQLRWFILDDQTRGKGYGRALLESAIEFCKEKNYERIILWTVSQLDQAIKLYRLNGFELAEEVEHDLWGNQLIEQRFDLKLK
jgi:GNAT superfamily N-acetyltransferase